MIKGDKIKLVKPMGVFDNIGEVCDVINVDENGVISFTFGNGLHLGCMSYDEFQNYFELVEAPPKRVWSEWKETEICYYNIYDAKAFVDIEYRHNGKKVQVRAKGLKAESTCSKYDDFNFDIGLDLAVKRLKAKILNLEVKWYADTF